MRHSPEASNPEGPPPHSSFLRSQQPRGAGQEGNAHGRTASENRTHCITVETVPDSVHPEPVEGPPPIHSSFLRRQESRGEEQEGNAHGRTASENRTHCITVETVPDSVHPEPVEGPSRPHSRHSPEASNPEGRGRARNPFPPRGGRLGWGAIPRSRHSPEASNPEGPPPIHSSFLRRQEPRGAVAKWGMLTAGPEGENRTQ